MELQPLGKGLAVFDTGDFILMSIIGIIVGTAIFFVFTKFTKGGRKLALVGALIATITTVCTIGFVFSSNTVAQKQMEAQEYVKSLGFEIKTGTVATQTGDKTDLILTANDEEYDCNSYVSNRIDIICDATGLGKMSLEEISRHLELSAAAKQTK